MSEPFFGLGPTITSTDVAVIDENSGWLGVSRLQLMENAGRSVAHIVSQHVKPGSLVVVFAGPGGNGGDGLTAARHLAYAGYDVKVVMVVRREQVRSEETARMLEALEAMDLTVEVRYVRSPSEIKPVDADAVIDALLGVGLRGAPRSPYAEAIEAINSSKGLKVAVDVPSGLDADTGKTPGNYVRADITVTFHKPKPGLLKRPDATGKLVVASIGAPPEAEVYIGPGDVAHRLKRRTWKAHKGTAGRVLVLGGSAQYVGAPLLAAHAAERGGVDLVYLAAPFDVRQAVLTHPTIIPVSLPQAENLQPQHIQQIRAIVERVDTIAVGMGLGQSSEAAEALRELLRLASQLGKKLVIDADGLKLLSTMREELREAARKTEIILTPHAREFEILFGEKLPAIDEDIVGRARIAARYAREYSVTLIVKGPIDIVTDGSRVRLNRTGAPPMSVGGTGDVLAGLTAAILAKTSLEPLHTAGIAAFTCGLAGMLAFTEKGESMTAYDVVEKIPEALNNPIDSARKVQHITYKRISRGRITWKLADEQIQNMMTLLV